MAAVASGNDDALVLGDGLAEGLSALRVLDRDLDGPAAEADGAGGVVDAAERDALEADLEPLVQVADQLPRLDADVLEHRLRLRAAGLAPHADGAARSRKPGAVVGTRNALIPPRRGPPARDR